jgi:tRNA pseudouridine38-40 synthase
MSTTEPVPPAGGDGLLRIRLDFAYDGTAFSGWATQPGRRTVEEELSRGLTRVLRAAVPVRLTVAGRTDAGVHARGAVAHADVEPVAWAALAGRSGRSPQEAALSRLRGVLPADVVVRFAAPAPAGFDARFSASWRRYRYRLCDQPATLDPLRRYDTVVHRRPLDVAAMHEASRLLLGLQDFAAFCKRREGATTVRTLMELGWHRDADGTVVGTVVADAFCHSMVRSLVGAVVPVGEGRRPAAWPQEILRAGRRDAAVVVMPPHGLSLEEVAYPADADLAERALQTRARRAVPGEAAPGEALPERA